MKTIQKKVNVDFVVSQKLDFIRVRYHQQKISKNTMKQHLMRLIASSKWLKTNKYIDTTEKKKNLILTPNLNAKVNGLDLSSRSCLFLVVLG